MSLKSGSQNSVHVEKLKDFIKFLDIEGVEQNIIDSLMMYHYGDDSIKGDGKIRYSA